MATITARQAALGTNAFRSLLRRVRLHTVPVYDYVLVTEPLSAAQLAAWAGGTGQGIGDAANQFHYYRLTADNRILWGGYDADLPLRPAGPAPPTTSARRPPTLAAHFFATFPQLEGVRFTHRWGGAIDTCTRFCAFFGTAHGGDVAYALGYTGLGVGATRFGAEVMLDLLAGEPTERDRAEAGEQHARRRSRPSRCAYAGIQLTRCVPGPRRPAAGRRNLWLRALDRLGLGFDS